MILSLIAAMAKHQVIGKDNKMPWHLPADLQHFKKTTLGKPVIMGRKTYDSIGRPLPGRRNCVVSRQTNLHIDGCDVFHSLDAALDALSESDEVMVIGGATLYELSLARADKLYLTFIEVSVEGDTFFPTWNEQEWKRVSTEPHQGDEKNKVAYRFDCFERVRVM